MHIILSYAIINANAICLICGKTTTMEATMNLEQRQKLIDRIHSLEGLLAYALKTDDTAEIKRIKTELSALVDKCDNGYCAGCDRSCIGYDAVKAAKI